MKIKAERERERERERENNRKRNDHGCASPSKQRFALPTSDY
jgi:hypothetical protein